MDLILSIVGFLGLSVLELDRFEARDIKPNGRWSRHNNNNNNNTAGAAANHAATAKSAKTAKYANLTSTHIFVPLSLKLRVRGMLRPLS